MAPFSHLLWLTYGLYMTTSTLLNGHFYIEVHIFAVILCIPSTLFHLTTLFPFSFQEKFVVFINCCIHSLQTLFGLYYGRKH